MSSAADTRQPRGTGDGVEELVVKWRLGGRASPPAREGGGDGGCRLRASSPPGSFWPVLGCGEQLSGVMGGETPATRGRVATRSCNAGAFQGNMAVGGGGFSPEAQCGAAALESHKGEAERAEVFFGLGVGAALNEAVEGERAGITAHHPWAEAEMLRSCVSRRPAHLVVRVYVHPRLLRGGGV